MRLSPLVLGATLLLASAWDVKAQKPGSEGQALFETRCGTCHDLERTKSKKKTVDEWQKTVFRMQQKRGSGITEAEAKSIAAFVAQNYGK